MSTEAQKIYQHNWYLKNRDRAIVRARAWHIAHPESASKASRAWQARNPDRKRGYWLKRYGISREDYDDLLTKQGGVCKICGGGPQGSAKHLSVDHSHQTGKVRGLLCGKCNTLLGMARDDCQLLAKASEYLAAAQSSL